MEWVIILMIVVVLFGAKRIPGLGAAIGEGLRNFKKAIGGQDDADKDKKEDGKIPPPSAAP
jgi:sec-independent protein translocase protein TatA